MAETRTPLRRSRRRRLLGGVCGGLAEWIGAPVLLVRIVWAVITLIPILPGLPLYFLMWLAVPLEPTAPAETLGAREPPARRAS